MRVLVLMRHAKAVPDDGDIADIDRPLNKRGREAAPLVARELIARGHWPDAVACSNAQRTMETLDLALSEGAAAGKPRPEARFERDLYLAEAPALIERARWFPATAKIAMLVGHNPGMHEAAYRLARKPRDRAEQVLADQLSSRFPTGTAAVLSFDTDNWREIGLQTGKLLAFIRPRDLSPA